MATFDQSKCEVESFCIVVDSDEGEKHYAVPISIETATALKDMLLQTSAALLRAKGDGDWTEFEVSENPKGSTAVVAELSDEMFARIKSIFDTPGRQNNVDQFRKHSKDVLYYYTIYKDHKGRKAIGFKRARTFKVSLKAKYLFLRESLEVVSDEVFKLDTIFDFLIDKTTIFAINATALEEIAQIESYIQRKFSVRALALARSVPQVDWSGIRTYADTRPRVQRLIIALSRRPDVKKVDPKIFGKLLLDCGAEFSVSNGVFCPKPKSEVRFLEALEGRRWLHNISGEHPIRYRALNRYED